MLINIQTDPTKDYQNEFESFKKRNHIDYVLGFSGGADETLPILSHVVTLVNERFPSFSLEEARGVIRQASRQLTEKIIEDVLLPLRQYRVAVLTGGTNSGIPLFATEKAKQLGFRTIGVFPLLATFKPHNLGTDLLDLSICVYPTFGKSSWGDESPVFTQCLDGVVIIGGGAGTMIEVAHMLKYAERTDVRPKVIVPITGSGGTADRVTSLPGKPKALSLCLPPTPVTDGTMASDFIRHRAFGEKTYEPKPGA